MAEWDWHQISLQGFFSALSGAGGLLFGLYKWGHKSAKNEQTTKEDYDGKIAALREEVRKEMAAHALKVESGNDLLVSQFKETFEGIRRQMDEHRFYTEKDFMKKEDFRDFRDEYREDMRDLKASIASISRN